MKQTKKQPQKKPINVQLSKDDLKELLTVLKDCIQEELEQTLHLHHHRMNCLTERITTLEYSKTDHQEEIHKLKQHCLHEDKFNRVSYFEFSGAFYAAVYKCERCGREVEKTRYFLSKKEKRALRKLGVKIV